MHLRFIHWLAVPLLTLTLVGSPMAQAQTSLDTRLGVAEGFRNPGVMADIHAGWERLILPWDQIQPGSAEDFSHLGITISDGQVQTELDRGEHLVGLFEFTPPWAAANPDAGRRSPPMNLDLPFDDPNNYWGRFITEVVRGRQLHLAGLRRAIRPAHQGRLSGCQEGQPERARLVSRHVVLGGPAEQQAAILRSISFAHQSGFGRGRQRLLPRRGFAQSVPRT
jgi:hypothetical protein